MTRPRQGDVKGYDNMGERTATLRAFLKARRTFLLLPIAGVAAGCVSQR